MPFALKHSTTTTTVAMSAKKQIQKAQQMQVRRRFFCFSRSSQVRLILVSECRDHSARK
jgi:hypothetical protein